MHLRTAEYLTALGTQTNTQNLKVRSYKPKNAFWLIPLGIFTIVSSLPSNALAFELQLANSPAQNLPATVLLAEDEGNEALGLSSQMRTHAVIASTSPVTELGEWPSEKNTRLAYTSTQKVVPTSGHPVVLEGEASYYSRAGCLGCDPLMIMANGQPLNDNALTMAIGADKKHLVGYTATVTSLATGKSVDVTITDTGGFYKARYGHRVADLTIATKVAIGMKGGVGQVRVEVH